MGHVPDDPLLTARQSAAEAGVSLPAFWRGVAHHLFPQPVYPLPRAPRWFRSELRAAIEARRMPPHEAKAARRLAKLAAR
jgi:predicted DNA-binding transcriptional regulator AlpA